MQSYIFVTTLLRLRTVLHTTLPTSWPSSAPAPVGPLKECVLSVSCHIWYKSVHPGTRCLYSAADNLSCPYCPQNIPNLPSWCPYVKECLEALELAWSAPLMYRLLKNKTIIATSLLLFNVNTNDTVVYSIVKTCCKWINKSTQFNTLSVLTATYFIVSSSFRLPKHAECYAPISSQAPDLQHHPSHHYHKHPGPTHDGLPAHA